MKKIYTAEENARRDSLYSLYCKHSVADLFVVGFSVGDSVYSITLTHEQFRPFVTVQKNEDGTEQLRFSPRTEEKQALLNMGARYFCSLSDFESEVKTVIKTFKGEYKEMNRGHVFERRIKESYGLPWFMDNIPFYEKPDMYTDSVGYEIKYQKGTLCHVSTLEQLEGYSLAENAQKPVKRLEFTLVNDLITPMGFTLDSLKECLTETESGKFERLTAKGLDDTRKTLDVEKLQNTVETLTFFMNTYGAYYGE